jgi:uncharacterized protein YdiU (UPF0061 family)
VLREYILSEAMHALGIPTTRALAVVATGEPVVRETVLPGAVLTRVAASHLRIGTFEYCAARGDHEALTLLVEYTLARHYPALHGRPTPALALLGAVCEAHAALVAQWMQVGFIHGVMNTDNVSIAGETLDYGPCAFLDTYDPATVFSAIDQQGRYAFGNQPRIAHWNLARLAETLLPLLDANPAKALTLAADTVNQFPARYERCWRAGMRRKLGLVCEQPDDVDLIDTLLALMHAHAADYTTTFRQLCAVAEGGAAPVGYEAWVTRWRARLAHEAQTPQAAAARMRAHNPAVIPRNHRVEAVLDAAVHQNDVAPLKAFLAVLATPYAVAPHQEAYSAPPVPSERVYQTFCGT